MTQEHYAVVPLSGMSQEDMTRYSVRSQDEGLRLGPTDAPLMVGLAVAELRELGQAKLAMAQFAVVRRFPGSYQPLILVRFLGTPTLDAYQLAGTPTLRAVLDTAAGMVEQAGNYYESVGASTVATGARAVEGATVAEAERQLRSLWDEAKAQLSEELR